MVILTLCDYYLPGFRAGGPISSLKNMVERLHPEFQFKIVTLDRDLGDRMPYPGIKSGEWQRMGRADVMHISAGFRGFQRLFGTLASGEYDLLYLNSMCSSRFSILPLILRRLGWLPKRPVLLAPRGECAPAALRLGRFRKTVFLSAAAAIGLHFDLDFHASTDFDMADIAHAFSKAIKTGPARIRIAPDLASPHQIPSSESSTRIAKRPGHLKLVFLSRISPMKNLKEAIDFLSQLRGQVEFDIVGPRDDKIYWKRCERRIAALPANITASYRGHVTPDKVAEVFRGYHAMLLPSRGENFGHVILEALSAGCPVVISDRTPWRKLAAKGVGWDLSLDRPEDFQTVLTKLLAMDDSEYQKLSIAASAYARRYIADGADVQLTRHMFRTVTGVQTTGSQRAA